jgi:hypothetical protein
MTAQRGGGVMSRAQSANDLADYLTERRAECLMVVGRIFDEVIASLAAGEPDGIIAAKLFAADEANGLLPALANLLLPSYSRGRVNCLQPAFSFTRAALIDRLCRLVAGPAVSGPAVLGPHR